MKHTTIKEILYKLAAVFSAVLCMSCANLNNQFHPADTQNDGQCSVTVTSSYTPARSALPSALPAENIYYFATISYTNNGTRYYLGASDAALMSPEYLVNKGTASDMRFLFTVPVYSCDYTLTLYLCTESTYSSGTCIASGVSDAFHLDEGQKAYTGSLSIEMTAPGTATGTGTVDLQFSWDSSLSVDSVSVSAKNESGLTAEMTVEKINNTYSTGCMLSGSLATGIYTVVVSLASSNGEIPLANPVQSVTVYAGFKTDTWYDATGSASGKSLTLAKDDQTTFYVCGSDPSVYGATHSITTVSAGSDMNNGRLLTPFSSLSAAVVKCTDTTKKYTIYVDGTTAETAINFGSGTNITIQPLGTTATIQRKDTSAADLIQNSAATVLVYNIIIDGNGQTGRGINNSGTLTLVNCTIQKFYATGNGGAIYTSGNLTLNGCTIQQNKATNGGGIYYDNSTQTFTLGNTTVIRNNNAESGGGIYLNAGTLNIGGSVKIGGTAVPTETSYQSSFDYGNYSSGSAGGGAITVAGGTCSLASSAAAISYNYGASGGVHIASGATLNLSGGTIDHNSSRGVTGTVQVLGTFNISGGTISNSTANSSVGVYVSGGTFCMSGSASVTGGDVVELNTGNTDFITVAGSLSGTVPVAKIYAPSITAGTKIIKIKEGVTDTIISAASGKFASSDTSYYIDTAGKKQSCTVSDPAAAISSIPAGEPVTLILSGDSTVSATTELTSGQNITLKADSSHKITNGSNFKTPFKVSAGASLTLGKNVTIDVASASYISPRTMGVSVSGGSFKLDGGTVTCSMTEGASPDLIDFSSGTLIITSGTIDGGDHTLGIRLECSNKADLVQISGGTIKNCRTGMYITGSCLNDNSSIKGLTISGNSATDAGSGGGLTFQGGASGWKFENCKIQNNTNIMDSGGRAGGILLLGSNTDNMISNITFTKCTIQGNHSEGTTANTDYGNCVSGGGIYAAFASSLLFKDCSITGNYTNNKYSSGHSYGGGIFVSPNASVNVVGGTLSGNTTKVKGTATNGCGSQAYVYYDSSSTTHGSLTIGVTEHAATTAAYVID